jgi:hypothetical protein
VDSGQWSVVRLRRIALGLVVLLLLAGFVRTSPVTTAGTCPPVQITLKYTIVYGSVTVGGVAALAGSVVEARSPRNDVVGCFVVTSAGEYGAMFVYGEDTSVSPPVPGMRPNEPVTFWVNSAPATANPALTWADDKTAHRVDLTATLPTTSVQISPASGGTLTSSDGHLTLNFPPGAVTSVTTVTYTAQLAPTSALGSFQFAGRSFTLEATVGGQPVTHFTGPFTLTLTYEDSDWQAAGISDENQLNLYCWDGSGWVGLLPCDGCSLDIVNNQLTAVLDHLTEFGLLACSLAADVDHNGVVDIRDIQQAVAGWRSTSTLSEIQAIAAVWGTGCGP